MSLEFLRHFSVLNCRCAIRRLVAMDGAMDFKKWELEFNEERMVLPLAWASAHKEIYCSEITRLAARHKFERFGQKTYVQRKNRAHWLCRLLTYSTKFRLLVIPITITNRGASDKKYRTTNLSTTAHFTSVTVLSIPFFFSGGNLTTRRRLKKDSN